MGLVGAEQHLPDRMPDKLKNPPQELVGMAQVSSSLNFSDVLLYGLQCQCGRALAV